MLSQSSVSLLAIKLYITCILSCIITSCSECPPTQWLQQCVCEEQTITCGGSENYNISKIFKYIDDNWTQPKKEFDSFILQNDRIEELVDNLFHRITFKKLFIINAVDLRRITTNAFSGTNDLVEEFHQIGKSNLGETNATLRELFDTLSTFANVKWIHFEGITIKSIPAHAFRNQNQDLLSVIDFIPLSPTDNYGLIESIGDYAFYYLKNLKFIELSYQKIKHISKNAFHFEKASNESLVINLADNYLTETSFTTGAFMNAKRPLFIHLYNNQIQHLEESIFLPFLKLDKRNRINIGGFNSFQCDCKSHWILREKNHIQDQIQGIQCRDKMSIWDKTENDFKNCHN